MKRVAAYVRMSTESQKYSTQNQLLVINRYAAEHEFAIARVYSDDGISGLQIKNRDGLKSLIRDVVKGTASFGAVLVYDVSRWGRFQDIDQSAFYEYLCRMNNVDVIYCAESFQGDHTPLSAILKTIRRAEAANYSRDLSVKVFNGQCNLARRGYLLGGIPPYGLKSVVVGDDGRPIRMLHPQTKYLRSHHVELAPGSQKEIRIVREVFRRYVKLGETTAQIAAYLNSKGYKTRRGCPWVSPRIGQMLVEEKYIGTMIFNRISKKLQGKFQRNDPSEWITKANAFPAIVNSVIFQQAKERRTKELQRRTDEELLMALRSFLSRHGYITLRAMKKFGGVPHPSNYCHRFGSLLNAYRLIGYKGRTKNANWKERVRRRQLRDALLEDLRRALDGLDTTMRVAATGGHFWVNETPCFFQLSASRVAYGSPRWLANFRFGPRTAFRLLGRLWRGGEIVIDYYLVPPSAVAQFPMMLYARNAEAVDQYCVRDLQSVAQRLVDSLKKARHRYGVMLPQIMH
jgi:DNA invertase Pin-like site-specific DNA recombinase